MPFGPSINLKSEREIEKMRRAGLIVWHALQIAGSMVRVGVTTGEIDKRLEQFFLDQKSVPLFKGYPGRTPYPAVTCISVNEQVVHGIPGSRKLIEGDIVSIDTGCKIDGWCGDSAFTFKVPPISPQFMKLCEICQGSLKLAIDLLPEKKKWSEVASEMEKYVYKENFTLVDSLVGHGIGREMHEDPQVPNCVAKDWLRYGDFELRPGLVIAIEPMVNIGRRSIKVLRDHWTVVTSDGKGSAHFEHTVAIMENGVRVLTGPPINDDEKIDISSYCD